MRIVIRLSEAGRQAGRQRTNPYAIYYSDSIFRKGARIIENPPFERIQIEIEFHFSGIITRTKKTKINNKNELSRAFFFSRIFWQINRKRRHINSSKIIDPFNNNRLIHHANQRKCVPTLMVLFRLHKLLLFAKNGELYIWSENNEITNYDDAIVKECMNYN